MLGVLVICSWCRVMGFVYHSRQNPMTCWRTLQIPFGLSPWRTFALGIRVFGVLWCAFACTRIVPFCCGSRGWKLYPVRMFLHAYSTHMISRKRCRNRSSLWWLRILSDSDYSLYFFFSFLYFFLFDHRKVTTGVERWTVGLKKSNSVACLCVTAGSKCSEAISSFFFLLVVLFSQTNDWLISQTHSSTLPCNDQLTWEENWLELLVKREMVTKSLR